MAYPPEKRAIRLAFGAAVDRYDDLAGVQRSIADALIAQLPNSSAQLILDAGCGTGYLAAMMPVDRQRSTLISLDLAEEMSRRAPQPSLCADIENLPLAARSIDLYVSSLAWQWTQPELAIQEARRVLKPGGQLCVASLGPESLQELRAAFAAADSAEHVRRFVSAEKIQSLLDAQGWHSAKVESRLFFAYAADVRGLIRDIRQLGAGVLPVRRKGLFGKQAWHRLQNAYEAFRCPAGLPVSYEALFISAICP